MAASTGTLNHDTSQQQIINARRTSGVYFQEQHKFVPTEDVDTNEAEKLNPEHGYQLKTKNGAIRYSNGALNGCCGVATISNVTFGNIKKGQKEIFYKEVEEHLLDVGKYFTPNMHRGALMMSDAVGGEANKQARGYPCIYDMCTYLGWDESHKYFNPRSGNYVVVFMKSKDMTGSPFVVLSAGTRPLVIKRGEKV